MHEGISPRGHGITESMGCGSTHGKDSTSNNMGAIVAVNLKNGKIFS